MKQPAQALGLTANEYDLVRQILNQHLPGFEVWAFGSRVKGNHRPYSDLDLAIIADSPIPLELRADLNETFLESDLPMSVDLVDGSSLEPSFQTRIRAQKIVFQPGLGAPDRQETA